MSARTGKITFAPLGKQRQAIVHRWLTGAIAQGVDDMSPDEQELALKTVRTITRQFESRDTADPGGVAAGRAAGKRIGLYQQAEGKTKPAEALPGPKAMHL